MAFYVIFTFCMHKQIAIATSKLEHPSPLVDDDHDG